MGCEPNALAFIQKAKHRKNIKLLLRIFPVEKELYHKKGAIIITISSQASCSAFECTARVLHPI